MKISRKCRRIERMLRAWDLSGKGRARRCSGSLWWGHSKTRLIVGVIELKASELENWETTWYCKRWESDSQKMHSTVSKNLLSKANNMKETKYQPSIWLVPSIKERSVDILMHIARLSIDTKQPRNIGNVYFREWICGKRSEPWRNGEKMETSRNYLICNKFKMSMLQP